MFKVEIKKCMKYDKTEIEISMLFIVLRKLSSSNIDLQFHR